MAEGRGSASNAMSAAGVVLLCLLLHTELVRAATYTVGNNGGWTFNVVSWPSGKRFSAGDVVVFKYDPSRHNVVAVNSGGYNACTTPRGSKVYQTGNDQIKLAKGQNYFICSFPGHCEGGMKIAISAA